MACSPAHSLLSTTNGARVQNTKIKDMIRPGLLLVGALDGRTLRQKLGAIVHCSRIGHGDFDALSQFNH